MSSIKRRIVYIEPRRGCSYQIQKKGWFFWSGTHLCRTYDEAITVLNYLEKQVPHGTVLYP